MTAAAERSEFARGWRVLAAAAIGIGFGISPIPFNVLGHLTVPLQAEFGWSRGEIMFSATILGVTVALCAPLFGALVDRFGVRRVALTALTLFSATWALIAATPANLLAFYLLWALMAVAGGASVPISWTRGVAAWFDARRGLALAVALAGTGVTAALVNMLAPALIAAGGWRAAILGTAALPILIALPIAFLWFREPPGASASDPSGRNAGDQAPVSSIAGAIREGRFWLMFTAFSAVALAFGGLYANFVPMLLDADFSAAHAGSLAGAIGLSIIAGRLIAGWLLDRFWAPYVAAPMLLAPVGACIALASGGITPTEAAIAAAALGLAAGAETDLIAYLAARYYGLASYGRIYGLLYMSFSIGTAVSAPLYGWSFDRLGSYDAALFVAAILFTAGALLLLFIGPYPADRAREQA